MSPRTARRHRVLLLDYRHADTPAREVGGPYTWAEALHAARQFAVGAQAALPVSNTGRELVLVDRPGGVLLSAVAPGSAAVVLEFIVTEDESPCGALVLDAAGVKLVCVRPHGHDGEHAIAWQLGTQDSRQGQ